MPKSVYTDIINQLSFWISSGCLSLFSTYSLSLHVFIKFPGAHNCVPMYPDIHVYVSSVDCYSLALAGVWLCNFVNIFHSLSFHWYITSLCKPSWGMKKLFNTPLHVSLQCIVNLSSVIIEHPVTSHQQAAS